MKQDKASRGVVDPELQRDIDQLAATKERAKEGAVKHARHWVRLTRVCNQRCLFCLDSWNQNGTFIDAAQLLEYIELGRELGRERLVLSGGEPTMHPEFLRFVRRGHAVGYDWVQTVTNGMMFAYPAFTRRAIQAGLDEVTMSIHGHEAALHDRLVGVPGAFDRALSGIKNIQALSRGRTVVNVDVVVNKLNVAHLREIIDLFRSRFGIHEFDLLHMVPFGRGFADHRDTLFFDIDDHFDDLQRAFEVATEPGVFIWTNRLPVQHLEGYEHLIQDPHKLLQEVQGGLHNFEGFVKRGIAPDCHGERCAYCFLAGLCADRLFRYRELLTAGGFERVRVDLDAAGGAAAARAQLERQRPAVLHVQASDADRVLATAAAHPFGVDPPPAIVAEARSDAGTLQLAAALGATARVVVASTAALERLLGVPPRADGPTLEVRLSGATAGWLLAEGDLVAPWIAARRLVGRLPNFEYLSEVRDNAVGPELLADLGAAGVALMNVAPCLGGGHTEPGAHDELSIDLLDDDGDLAVFAYVQRYIVGEYYQKSLRCRDCARFEGCRGMHINYLRAHGFAALEPIGGGGD